MEKWCPNTTLALYELICATYALGNSVLHQDTFYPYTLSFYHPAHPSCLPLSPQLDKVDKEANDEGTPTRGSLSIWHRGNQHLIPPPHHLYYPPFTEITDICMKHMNMTQTFIQIPYYHISHITFILHNNHYPHITLVPHDNHYPWKTTTFSCPLDHITMFYTITAISSIMWYILITISIHQDNIDVLGMFAHLIIHVRFTLL